ncbi:MAG TPA: sugar phosphate isomerase/epimerase [Fimbriiglobus sp.]|nr:sugar phosphate isomerase/epimerase [Fimbriiglobus sp.]
MQPHDTPLGRRDFLKSATVAGAIAVTGKLTAAPAKVEFSDGYTIGIQSYTFRKFPLERALKMTRDLGLKYAEFYNGHVSPSSSPEKIAGVKKLCGEYDITPVAFGVERFTKDHDANKKLFEFAAALGVKSLSADPDPDSFDSLDKLVAEHKIAIAIHPHGPQGKGLHRWYSAEVILKAVKDHNELIGTCLDTGHLIRSAQLGKKLDPAQQIRLMGKRNFGIHLKDHDNKRKTDVPFGDPTGALDVPGVLKALKEVGFKGSISIEYEAHADDPSADVRKCLAYLKEAAGKLG